MEIEKLLDRVENKEIVIPEFQREYVWPLEDAKQLLISIYKGYPTGSLLFWETNNPPEIKNNAVDTQRHGLINVILDGQQRLTTLYLLIKGEIPPYYKESEILNDPRHLYFNLLTEEFQFYTKRIMESNTLWRGVTDCFNNNEIDEWDIAEEYINKYKEKANEYKNITKQIGKSLNNLKNIRNNQYSILSVPQRASISEAIDVFDRVNSKGTKLTDAELVLTHFVGHWAKARMVMKKKIEQLKQHNFEFSLDFMTRCMVITLTDSALFKRNARLKYDQYTKKEYEQAWEKVNKALDYLIPILQQDALISSTNDLSTNNVLVPIIAYLVNNKNRFVGNLRHKFLYWMFLAMIWGRYSGQTDQRLDKDVYITLTSDTPIDDLVAEIEDQRGRIDVKPSDLVGRAAGHPLYKFLYVITKNKEAIDWSNGGTIHGTLGDYYSIQSHHIFPQKYLYKNKYNSENLLDKKKVNEIANRAFITRDTNYSIGAKSPAEYLPEVERLYPGALEKQFIPKDKDLWTSDNYERFLEKRRELIANEMNKFLNSLYKKEYQEEVEQSTAHMEKQSEEQKLKETIRQGENNFVEFKATLWYDVKAQKPQQYLEHAIAKTICAFLNSEGGTLMIGVDSEGNIHGLENDFNTFTKGNPHEAFSLKFEEIIDNYLGDEFLTDITTSFKKVDRKEIFVIKVLPSKKPVFLQINGQEEFFVRQSHKSHPYSMKEAIEYIDQNWS